MKKPLQILIVEDNPDDADMLLGELRRAGFDPQWKRVEIEEDFLTELKKVPDLVISDYSMPLFDGLRAAELLQESGLNIPFILVSGTVGEDVAVEAMKHGATDYLLKDRIARLGAAVEQALEKKRLSEERKRAEKEISFQKLLLEAQSEASIDGILTVDANAKIISFNRRFVEIWGIPNEIVARRSDEPVLMAVVDRIVDSQQFLDRVRYLYEHSDLVSRDEILLKDGKVFDRYTAPVKGEDGTYYGRIWTFRDITLQKRAQAELQEREEQLRLYAEHSPAAVAMFDRNMKYLVVSHRWIEDYRMEGESLIGHSHYDVFNKIPQHWIDVHRRCLEGATESCEEEPFVRNDGTVEWIHWEALPWRQADGSIGGIIIFSEDITLRKQADEENRTQLDELRRWHEAMLGREDRVLDLKNEVNVLLEQLKQAPRYTTKTP